MLQLNVAVTLVDGLDILFASVRSSDSLKKERKTETGKTGEKKYKNKCLNNNMDLFILYVNDVRLRTRR